MGGRQQGAPDLRVEIPTLEPDPVFLVQLAALAAATGVAAATVRPPRHRAKVALAAASVALLATGGAWASGTLPGGDTPQRPDDGPVTRPSAPATTPAREDPAGRSPETHASDDTEPREGSGTHGPVDGSGDTAQPDSPGDEPAPSTGVQQPDTDGANDADDTDDQGDDQGTGVGGDDAPDGATPTEADSDRADGTDDSGTGSDEAPADIIEPDDAGD